MRGNEGSNMDESEVYEQHQGEPQRDQPSADEPTQERSAEHPEGRACPPPPTGTVGCEAGVDDIKCVAEGDRAKSLYHDTFGTDLAQAKIDYEATRRDYRAEQRDAAPIVQALENEIRHLVERIKCQIEQKRVWKCLDDAFSSVRDEIRCCPSPSLCCDNPCDFPLDDIEGNTGIGLAVLIQQYQERTDAAKKCFTDLRGEPAALKARVLAAKMEVASITTDLGGDRATVDLKRLYARALVVRWQIKIIWGPFGQVQKFVDCLCQALTCWTQGCHAVYQLTGAKAVAECKERAKQERCNKLRAETVEQVLAAYDRLCAEPECTDEPSHDDDEYPGDGADDAQDDCDCEHHNHHHHHHHGGHKNHHHKEGHGHKNWESR